MPRAYCSQCGAEVPVDPEGRCHLGHVVEPSSAGSTLEVELDTTDPAEQDEPEPWVASVDETTLGGYTPPPGAAADDARPADDLEDVDAVGRDAGADLPPAQQPAATSPTETDAWRPPTADPAGPGPQPPPVPADQPEELVDDFDLDDLEAAVAQLEGDGETTTVEPQPSSGSPTPPPTTAPDTAPPPPPPAPAEEDWDDDGDDLAAAETEDEPVGPVDLSSFTASGSPVDGERGDGGKKRRFGFGR